MKKSELRQIIREEIKKIRLEGKHYPEETPEDYWASMFHDGEGESYEDVKRRVEKAFKRKLTPSQLKQLKKDWDEVNEE